MRGLLAVGALLIGLTGQGDPIPPNPDPHGPYWQYRANAPTGLGNAVICVGSPSGHTTCSQPAGSAGPNARRHHPLARGPLTAQDNRRIDLLVAGRCQRRGQKVVLTYGPTISNLDGAWQWSRDVSWIGRRGTTSVVGLITSGYAPIITSHGSCGR